MKNDNMIVLLLKEGRWIINPTLGTVRNQRGALLGQWDEHNGYFRTEVTRKGHRYRFAIHRIIWISVNGKPKHGTLINHKNANTRHNWIGNLERSSHSHNTKHAYAMGCRDCTTNHNHRDAQGNFARVTAPLSG
jgi:hypothetical protein